jgi:hypothetical protein
LIYYVRKGDEIDQLVHPAIPFSTHSMSVFPFNDPWDAGDSIGDNGLHPVHHISQFPFLTIGNNRR